MSDLLITLLVFLAYSLMTLVVISRGNGKSVNDAAKKAADSVRKNLENKIYKYNPWLKGYDPTKNVSFIEESEKKGDEE